MDRTDELFPGFDAAGMEMIRVAYDIAAHSLAGQTRGNGRPFVEHPVGVARIAAEEIGLPAECIAAVFLHEAMRFEEENNPERFLSSAGLQEKLLDRNADNAADRHGISGIFGKDVLKHAAAFCLKSRLAIGLKRLAGFRCRRYIRTKT